MQNTASRNRRGIAVPIATMFMILIIILSIAFMIYLLHRVSEISKTGVQIVKEEKEKIEENAELFVAKVSIRNLSCNITLGLLNTGSVTLTASALYVFLVQAGNYTELYSKTISLSSSPGELLFINITGLPYVTPANTTYYVFKVVSTRGNVYTAYWRISTPMAYLFISPPLIYSGCRGSAWLIVINNLTEPLFDLTASLNYSPSTANITISNATPSTIERLPPGATAVFYWNFTALSLDTTNVTFTASLTSFNVTIISNKTVSVIETPKISSISVKILLNETLCRSGSWVIMYVNVTNFGPNPVEDVLPEISMIGVWPNGSLTVSYTLLDTTPQIIAPGNYTIFRYNLTCSGTGKAVIFAYAYGRDAATGHRIVSSEAPSQMLFIKTGGLLSCIIIAPSTVITTSTSPGYNVTLVVKVRNIGDVDVYNVTPTLSLTASGGINPDADIVLGPIPDKVSVLPPNSEAVFKYIINVTGTDDTRIYVTAVVAGIDYFGSVLSAKADETLFVRGLMVAVGLNITYLPGNLPPPNTVTILYGGTYAKANLYAYKPPYFRVLVNITSPFRRINFPTPVFINFTELLQELGISGTLDVNSIRVLNATTLSEIPYNYTLVSGFDAETNACMWIVFPANTTPGAVSQVYIYFNILENAISAAPSQYYNVSYVDSSGSSLYDTYYYIVLKYPHEFYYPSSLIRVLYGDDRATSRALPFYFPFYGTSYDTVYLSTNGFMRFTRLDTTWYTVPYTVYFTPKDLIAPFQMDLYSSVLEDTGVYEGQLTLYELSGMCYYYYMNYYDYYSDWAIFEAILLESGDIVFSWNRIDRYYGWSTDCQYFYAGISRGNNIDYLIVSTSDPTLTVPVSMYELTSVNVLFIYKPNLLTTIGTPEIDYNAPFEAIYRGFFNYTIIIYNKSPDTKWQVRFSFDRLVTAGVVKNFTVVVYNATYSHKEIIVEDNQIIRPIPSWFTIAPQSEAYVLIDVSTTDEFTVQLYLEAKIAYRDDLYGYILPFTVTVNTP